MLFEMFAALTMQPNAVPIVLRHTRPARDVVASKTSICGDMMFEIQYSSTARETRGTIRARQDGQFVDLADAQSALFDKLKYIDDTVVSCGDDDLPTTVLVSGVDRTTSEPGKLYEVGYLPATGFGEVRQID